MLISRTCPLTGVVNLYRRSEPHLAVGTILVHAEKGDQRSHVSWWCHAAPGTTSSSQPSHGTARDLLSAEASVADAAACAADGTRITRH